VFELKERISYLNGLLDGLEISDATKEGKAIKAVAEVLNEIVDAVTDLAYAQEDILDYVDCIDEDLAALEDEVYGERFIEMECPNCGETVSIDLSILEDSDAEVVCPECGESFTTEDVIKQMCHSLLHCCEEDEDWEFDDDWYCDEDEDEHEDEDEDDEE